tara:strand:- start:326 stop:1420 length:1095 start_codon:yes stop_codon:yes gene_type:complete
MMTPGVCDELCAARKQNGGMPAKWAADAFAKASSSPTVLLSALLARRVPPRHDMWVVRMTRDKVVCENWAHAGGQLRRVRWFEVYGMCHPEAPVDGLPIRILITAAVMVFWPRSFARAPGSPERLPGYGSMFGQGRDRHGAPVFFPIEFILLWLGCTTTDAVSVGTMGRWANEVKRKQAAAHKAGARGVNNPLNAIERAVPHGTDQIMRDVLEHAHKTRLAADNVLYTPMHSARALQAAKKRARISGGDLEVMRLNCATVEMAATAQWRIPRLMHLTKVGRPVNAHRDVAMRTAHKVRAGPTHVGSLVVPLIDHWMDNIHLALRVLPPSDGRYHSIIRRADAPGSTQDHPLPECVAGQRFQMCF